SPHIASIQSISLKNIIYRHPKVHAVMGNSLNFSDIEVLAGEKIALLGKSGAGKSTFANIICGFKEYDQGDYLINGISIKELSRQQVFHRFFLLEKPSLFRGTILQNITLSENSSDKDRLTGIMKN